MKMECRGRGGGGGRRRRAGFEGQSLYEQARHGRELDRHFSSKLEEAEHKGPSVVNRSVGVITKARA